MQPPEKVIERSGIKENMVAAEIGCGSGAFTTFTARAVGKNGTIYALDIQQDMLDQLKKKLEKEQFKDIKNIKLLLGSAYELPLDDESVDIVYFVSVFQEIPDIPRVLKETKRVLKENGVLAISEFFFDPDYPLRKTTLKQGLAGGFILEGIFGNFWNYTARFKKSLTL